MRTLSLIVAVGVAGCALAPEPVGEPEGEGDEVLLDGQALLGGKADGDEHLRVQLPPVTVVPGIDLEGRRLDHSVVTAELDLAALLELQVQVRVPADFFLEAGSFLLYDLPVGREVSLAVETWRYAGEKMHVYVQRIPGWSEGRQPGMAFAAGNAASFVVEPSADPIADPAGMVVPETSHYLVLVLPAELRAGHDHVLYDLRARVR